MTNPYLDTATASRYNAARALPQQTKDLWMSALKAGVGAATIGRILDLGCGTGRFTAALAETFACPVVGVEPSAAMLDIAKAQDTNDVQSLIEWKEGSAENIPLESQSVDLAFMSQVVHHLAQPELTLQELGRVLVAGGYLAIRNGTRESDSEVLWMRYFPEAEQLDSKRIPTRAELVDWVSGGGFALISQQSIQQRFADSFRECYSKVSQRGLSSLISIDDVAFERGLEQMQKWVQQQPADIPVDEPVELFIFRKE